jgi:ABC-type polysaccharide/polyol phosphate transport system ATPase subunit
MSKTDISVVNVSKRYMIPDPHADGVRSFYAELFRRKEIWALRNVSFEVLRGEALGIVGDNGAGKSTLVKLLSGITVPTTGELIIRGKLSALVEVGAGFNVELTGRENVFFSGAILGMDRREVGRKLPEIIEFADIGDQIDAPVKTYSSGEFVRLGFSIAAQLDNHIFILDEVLAVGDISFQQRCFSHIDNLRRTGKTIVLISHDLAAVERVCDRAILMNKGSLVMTADPRAVIDEYSRTTLLAALSASQTFAGIALSEITFEGPEGGPVRTGEVMLARASFFFPNSLDGPVVTISFYWPSGYLCTQITSADICHQGRLGEGRTSWEFVCPMLAMQRGFYRVDVSLEQRGQRMAHWPRCSLLRVELGKAIPGDYYLAHSCNVTASRAVADTSAHGQPGA